MTDPRTFHYTATTGVAACGARLGPTQLGSSARGLAQLAGQYPDLACPACADYARARAAR